VCLLLYFLLLGGLGAACWPSSTYALFAPGVRITNFPLGVLRMSVFAAGYGVIYLSLGKWLRGRLPAALVGNHLARFLLPLVLLAFLLVPMLIDVFTRGSVDGWHAGHAMNPFWTIERFAFHPDRGPMLAVVLGVAGVCLTLQGRGLVAGLREVLAAAGLRRASPAGTTKAASDV
jgi:hypothetical protein